MSSQPPKVDLTQFTSVEDAITKVASANNYASVAKPVLASGLTITSPPVQFYMSMVNRCTSLHTAVAREMEAANPHAVFTLLRAYAEDVLVLIYVRDKPTYIAALTTPRRERRANTPNRRTIASLVAHAQKHAPGFADAYNELSEFAHFGALAMWTSHAVREEHDGHLVFSWSGEPHWRNEKQALTAAAWALEISGASHDLLESFAQRHLAPPSTGAV